MNIQKLTRTQKGALIGFGAGIALAALSFIVVSPAFDDVFRHGSNARFFLLMLPYILSVPTSILFVLIMRDFFFYSLVPTVVFILNISFIGALFGAYATTRKRMLVGGVLIAGMIITSTIFLIYEASNLKF